jgi:hypothetical protein
MSYPYFYLGPTCQLEPFFTMKSKKQLAWACLIDAIGASACPMAVFSGFYESPVPPPLGDEGSIVPLHCNGHRYGHQSGYIFNYIVVCLLLPWRPLRRYGFSSCPMPMAASSGFRCSPGHAALGDAPCITSMPLHGHRNDQQQRCIRSLPPPFSLGVIVAKDRVMVH